MTLLGHVKAEMTMKYVQVTGEDLQREFHLARSQPRPSAGSLLRTPRPARPSSAELLSYQAYRPDSADSILYYPI